MNVFTRACVAWDRPPFESSDAPQISSAAPSIAMKITISQNPGQPASRAATNQDENGLDIEYHEEHRHQIEFHGQADPCRPFRHDARFVRRRRRVILVPLAQEVGHREHSDYDENYEYEVNA
jgi:hypothetical protein